MTTQTQPQAATESALSDIRVVDLSQTIPGPFCTKLLADFGAEVIKVEPPEGDPSRAMGPFPGDIPHPEKSGLFLHLNTNKKGITLSLQTDTGRKLLRELVRDADLLVESYGPGVMEQWGLGYGELEQINPRLVLLSMSNFGQWGPYRDYQLSELALYALGGTLHHTGVAEREPVKMALTVIQFQMGQVAAVAAMAGVLVARGQGAGQQIDFSLFEAQAGTIDRGGINIVTSAFNNRQPSIVRSGPNTFRTIQPNGIYPCADGYIQVTAGRPAWFMRFLKTVGREDLLAEERYKPFPDCLYNMALKEEIEAITLEWCLARTKRECQELAQANEWPVTAVNTIEDLFSDPHFRGRDFFVEIDHPVAGKLEYPGAPALPALTPWRAGRAPLLGEHNWEVYCGRLGYAAEDLVRLRQQGVM
ncbi:MAG: CoA transferase [Chloroflexi bacterium]|nr:CoA transferase [Chloroflexota bacterium]